jgi:hypothetical protein
MSDEDRKLVEDLRCLSANLEGNGWPQGAAKVNRAADLIEKLTATKEPKEGSVEVKIAVLVDSEGYHAACAVDCMTEDHAFDSADSELEGEVTHRCIAIVRCPPIVATPIVNADIEPSNN